MLRSQLSAVFNHLVRYHGLASNPVNMTLSFEGSEEDACDVWTVEEYLSFSSVVAGKPQAHIAFEILFWCGLRRGEMLALTYGDVDLGKGILRVSKTLSKVGNRDVVGPPKTRQSYRTVAMPQLLVEELGEYFSWNGGASPSDRLLSKVTASIRGE